MVAVTIETTAQTEVRGESHPLTDIGEETTAQGIEKGRKDMEKRLERGRSILQMKTGGTLATGEGDARGP